MIPLIKPHLAHKSSSAFVHFQHGFAKPLRMHGFGRRLRLARESRQLSQDDLGMRVRTKAGGSVTGSTVNQWEGEQTIPTLDKALQLPDLLLVDAMWLFYGRGLREQEANSSIDNRIIGSGVKLVPKVDASLAIVSVQQAIEQTQSFVPSPAGGSLDGDFAIDIGDDSNAPVFSIGDYVLLRPSAQPSPGKQALVSIFRDGSRHAAFGRLGRGQTSGQNGWILHFGNPLWGNHALEPGDKIIAVMTAHVRVER